MPAKPQQAAENAEIAQAAPWYESQSPDWELARTLLAGTRAMRDAGPAYLPRFSIETEEAYNRRLGVATLTNFYKRMALKMAGLMFSRNVTVEGSKLPEAILSNIDRRGASVHQFARRMAVRVLTRGLHNIVVDMPQRPAGAQTLGDDIALGLRPYWVSLPAEAVFSAFAVEDNNAERLLQVRWRADGSELNGYAIESVERIRLLKIDEQQNVSFELWQLKTIGRGDKTRQRWVIVESGALSPVKSIPFVTIYADRYGFMLSRPPLADVAYKNVEHWQSGSDQRNILTVSRYPTQYQVGTQNPVTVTGPGSLLHSPGNSTDVQKVEFGYIEPAGTGIEAGERDLDRIVAEAEALGMELLVRAPAATATEAKIDYSNETSPLQDIAQAMEDGLNHALRLTAEWSGIDPDDAGQVRIPKDWGISADDAKAIDAILRARATGDLSRETMWAEFRQRGVFLTGFDVDTESLRLAQEGEAAMSQLALPAPPAPDDEDA